MSTTHQNPNHTSILSLAVSGRAIGATHADKLGLVRTEMLSLQDFASLDLALLRFRTWLTKLLHEIQPTIVVLEDLIPKRRTKKSLSLSGLLESLLDHWGSLPIKKVGRKIALQWLMAEMGEASGKVKPSLRSVAPLLAKHCTELAFHPPPQSRLRTDWDRSWGQAIVAGALALYAKEHF